MFQRGKLFTTGRPQPLKKAEKNAIMARARELARKEPGDGRAYGRLTAKDLSVLRVLLFEFHGMNAKVFPSYERIAQKAACARSTVGAALRRLEQWGLLTWRHRLKRIVENGATLVRRASNVYAFLIQAFEKAQKSEKRPQNPKRAFFSSIKKPSEPDNGLEAALDRLGRSIRAASTS